MHDKDLPRHVRVANAEDQLKRCGFDVREAPPGEAMTAGDLATLLNSGIKQGIIDADKPLKLEDPNLMHPWDVKGVRLDGDALVLDVWGED